MPGQEEYKKILSDLIKKQMVILGPNIALDTARKVAGLTIADDGEVLQLAGDGQMVLKALGNAYVDLSGPVAKLTLPFASKK